MALDIGPVGVWTSGLWQGDDETAEAVAELDEVGYRAGWQLKATARQPVSSKPRNSARSEPV
jgi:hypothetical protein